MPAAKSVSFLMTVSPTAQSPAKTSNKAERENSLSTPLTAAVVALFIVGRLWRLSASCLWFDEIFSVHAARHGWAELLRFVAADIIHPPLFYLLLKIWISLGGESLLWLRLLPALIGMAAIIPFLLLCSELELKQTERTVALLLLAVNGYLIKYAQELRMYSLLMFLSLCSLWLFVRFFKAEHGWRKQLGWLYLINLLLVYSHYAGWIVVAVECLALVIWQRRKVKTFLIAFALLLLAYAPWVFLVNANREAGKGLAQNIGWVTRPTLWDVTQFYALLNKPFWFIQSTAARPYDLLTALFAILILGAPLVFLSLRLWRAELVNDANERSFRALFLFLLAPVILVFGLSWLLPDSVWGTRHLIVVAAPYAILVSVAILRFPVNWLRIAVGLILGSWFLLAGVTWALARPPVFIWCAWEPLARNVEASAAQAAQEVRVYAFEDLVAYHLWFAFDSSQLKQFKVMVVKGVEGVPEDPAYFLPRRFNEIAVINSAQITGDDIWIAYRAPRWDEKLPPLSTLERMGYTTRNVQSIPAQGQQAFVVRMRRR
ncbi:MAG: mannosyltransferase [Pyrinomonadaceae bacterium]|nr:mannosyltransferase [Pyrinomonadaceae bacterium]